jgi:hypothetical protein
MAGGTYVRNFTTVMPLLFIFAGYGLYILLKKVVSLISNTVVSSSVICMILLLINYNSLFDSYILIRDHTRSWNREVLNKWAGEHFPSGVTIRNDNMSLEYVQEKNMNIIPLEQRAENSLAEFQEAGDDFAIINLFWNYNLFFWSLGPEPKDMINNGPIPYKILDETYSGIALREMLNYTVYEIYKARQAPEYNYFVVKVPKLRTDQEKEISSYSFDEERDKWNSLKENGAKSGIEWDGVVGKTKKGSIVFRGGGEAEIYTRIESDFIKVKPDTQYRIKGFLKAVYSINIEI